MLVVCLVSFALGMASGVATMALIVATRDGEDDE